MKNIFLLFFCIFLLVCFSEGSPAQEEPSSEPLQAESGRGLACLSEVMTKNKATMKLVDSLSRSEGRKEGEIRWNFTKFLISKDGSVIKRFPPVAEPKDMEADIEAMLKQ